MFRDMIIDPTGIILAAVTFIFSLFLFYSDTSVFWGSFAAALMAAGLAWLTYVILRVFYLAIKR